MSEIVEINISDYAELSPSISLQDFPYENITSTSSLIFSARSSDLDGAFGGLQFFLDGRSLGSTLHRSPGLSQEESIYLFITKLMRVVYLLFMLKVLIKLETG